MCVSERDRERGKKGEWCVCVCVSKCSLYVTEKCSRFLVNKHVRIHGLSQASVLLPCLDLYENGSPQDSLCKC